MKQTIKRSIIAGAAMALLATPAIVSAEDGPNTGSGSAPTGTTSSPYPSPSTSPRPEKVRQFEQKLQTQLQQMKEQRQVAIQDKMDGLEQKLDNAKKRACENHQATISRLMNVMDKRRQNAFDNITKVSEKVQAFYTEKRLSVANYDDLVAAVSAAQTAAHTAMIAQQAIPSLDCSGDHPRADVADFKEKRAGSIDAMKAYRDAVKNLVKAVKTAADVAKGDL
jgi:hypothetical protein